MVVKIISENPVTSKKTICDCCGVRLEYNKVDVKKRIRFDYGGFDYGVGEYFTIECPGCRFDTPVKVWY